MRRFLCAVLVLVVTMLGPLGAPTAAADPIIPPGAPPAASAAVQALAGRLPSEGRFGFAAEPERAPYIRWSDVLAQALAQGRSAIRAAGLMDHPELLGAAPGRPRGLVVLMAVRFIPGPAVYVHAPRLRHRWLAPGPPRAPGDRRPELPSSPFRPPPD